MYTSAGGGGYGMAGFDDTLQVIDGIQKSATTQQVASALLGYSRQLGLHAVMAGMVPTAKAPRDTQVSNVLFADWPPGWFRRYVSKNYAMVDPIVMRAAAEPTPFTWTEAYARFAAGRSEEAVIRDAVQFRLRDGFASPLTTIEGGLVLVSLGGESLEAAAHERNALALITAYAVGRALQLSAAPPPALRPTLTEREAECLRWAAIGKSEWEISQILGISEHTAERHLQNARARLGAVNRVQAVAEAIRLGIIA